MLVDDLIKCVGMVANKTLQFVEIDMGKRGKGETDESSSTEPKRGGRIAKTQVYIWLIY
jgi:hypothetical protein